MYCLYFYSTVSQAGGGGGGGRSVTIFLNSIKMAPKKYENLSKNLDLNLWSLISDLSG